MAAPRHNVPGHIRAQLRALHRLRTPDAKWNVEIGDAEIEPEYEVEVGPAEDVHRRGDRPDEVSEWERNPDQDSLDISRRKRR